MAPASSTIRASAWPWTPRGISRHVVRFVHVGDEVYYGKFGGNEVKVDGEDFLLLRADDIYAIIED